MNKDSLNGGTLEFVSSCCIVANNRQLCPLYCNVICLLLGAICEQDWPWNLGKEMMFFGLNLENLWINAMFFMFEQWKINLMRANCTDANVIHLHQIWLFTIFQFDLNDPSACAIGHSICHSNILIDHDGAIEYRAIAGSKQPLKPPGSQSPSPQFSKNHDSQALSFLAKVLSPEQTLKSLSKIIIALSIWLSCEWSLQNLWKSPMLIAARSLWNKQNTGCQQGCQCHFESSVDWFCWCPVQWVDHS